MWGSCPLPGSLPKGRVLQAYFISLVGVVSKMAVILILMTSSPGTQSLRPGK